MLDHADKKLHFLVPFRRAMPKMCLSPSGTFWVSACKKPGTTLRPRRTCHNIRGHGCHANRSVAEYRRVSCHAADAACGSGDQVPDTRLMTVAAEICLGQSGGSEEEPTDEGTDEDGFLAPSSPPLCLSASCSVARITVAARAVGGVEPGPR